MATQRLARYRDGRMLCLPHRSTGCPVYHVPGCEACEEARARGVQRPDIDSVGTKQRGRRRHLEKRYDWNKIPKDKRLDLALAIIAGRIETHR